MIKYFLNQNYIYINFCFLSSDETSVRGEVVLLENFVNANNKRFSEVYFKTETITSESPRSARGLLSHNKRSASIASRQVVEQIDDFTLEELNINGVNISASYDNPTLETNNVLLFKLRKIFFKALPSYRKNIANILKRAWLSKLNQTAFDLQNGLRLEVRIYEISNFMTYQLEETFGFKYTIAINGQDPKFLGIQEPTFEDFIRETKREQKADIVFCPCNTFEIDRLYIDSSLTNVDQVLDKLWLNANRFVSTRRSMPVLDNRIVRKSKLDINYYDANMRNLSRLAISWLVDGAEPNPVFFNRPGIKEITKLLAESNVKVFNDTPYIKKQLDLVETQHHVTGLIKGAIQSAWSLVNPTLNKDLFSVFLEYEDKDRRSVSLFNYTEQSVNVSTMRTKRSWILDDNINSKGMNYFIGIDGTNYDVNDLNQPDVEVVKRAIRAQMPDAKFASDMAHAQVTEEKNPSKTMLMTIIGSSLGAFALIMIVVIVVSIAIRRQGFFKL